jgi:ribonuclease HII
MILGIDEVGRGSWAGPLVVGAVVLGGANIEGLTDSKKLTQKRRKELDCKIRQHAYGVGLGWVDALTIDKIGLSESLRLATRLAVEQIHAPYHEIIIDGTINFLSNTTKSEYVKTIKKADLLIPSVSAASIVAKVARDEYMIRQHDDYPEYGFNNHVGYGTAIHTAAIKKFGVTPLHRLSFGPLKSYSGAKSQDAKAHRGRATTKTLGDAGENEAVRYLCSLGHIIIERNWKTRYCEIDIISSKGGRVYFTEVKYRKNTDYGGGVAAVTKKKLKQMTFAARFYESHRQLHNDNLCLAVISLSGIQPAVDQFLEI